MTYEETKKKAMRETSVYKKLLLTQDLIGMAPNEQTAMEHAREATLLRRKLNQLRRVKR